KDYLAFLSYLPLRHYRTIPRFIRLSLETRRQLSTSKGLIGYSLLAQIFRRRFWTLSAWEDFHCLTDFTSELPHLRIIQELSSQMGETQFIHWTVQSSAIPLEWSDALPRIPQP